MSVTNRALPAESASWSTRWESINSVLATAGLGAMAVGEARLEGETIVAGVGALVIVGLSECLKNRRQHFTQ